MGRKRKFNPAIPAHIDQRALPAGIYWELGRWYILVDQPEGRPKKKTIAGPLAKLSELHAAVEDALSGVQRGTLSHLMAAFKESTEYRDLSPGTRRGYDTQAATAGGWKLKNGSTLGQMQLTMFDVPTVQRLVETIAAGRSAHGDLPALPATPSKANHVLRFMRRLFAWGIRHGYCRENPCKGVREAKELGEFKMPTPEAQEAVLAYARTCAARKAHTRGSISPYMPSVMVLAYAVRLRGIEVSTLTDAHITTAGIVSNRTKGSLDNLTTWDSELRAAVDWLQAYRAERMKDRQRPVPLRPEHRQLLTTESGTPLTKSALDSAWQRLIRSAITKGVITEDQRFSLHGLKHRGITDSDNEADGGHRTLAMRQRYRHRLDHVKPAKRS